MKILFMGTPDFAVPCMERLIADGHELVGAVTQPDKPKGRGQKLLPPPVKELAMTHGIPVYQPQTLKSESFLPELKKLNPELIVVVAYGKYLPKYILDYPHYGCINVHASLLPKYRGAGPIHWCIIEGETVSGVSIMFMGETLDGGDVILQKETPIGEEETAGELFDRLSYMGADLLAEAIPLLEKGEAPRAVQDETKVCYAPMVTRETGKIDWSKNAKTICNLVRGTNPWPMSHTLYQGVPMKIIHAAPGEKRAGALGEILAVSKRGILIACGEGETLLADEIQMQGGKRMAVRDYINGHQLEIGTILE